MYVLISSFLKTLLVQMNKTKEKEMNNKITYVIWTAN